MLGGVRIPHERGLLGHSDGDCAAHALADAVLGAAGLGDIGHHFPSSDDRWKDVAGLTLLAEVAAKLREAACVVLSTHVVVVAEEPRLGPHLQSMAAAMAEALGVSEGIVVVSASSSDGMGYIGRAEGISASAVALVSRAPVAD